MNSAALGDPSIQQRWAKLDEEMMPLIRTRVKKIRRFTGAVSYEDAIQEGRLALLSALLGYREKDGELERYVNRVLYNRFVNLGMSISEDTHMLKSLDSEDLYVDCLFGIRLNETPEKIVSNFQSLELVVEYDEGLFERLNKRERKLYRKFITPNYNVQKKDLPERFRKILAFLEGRRINIKKLGKLIGTDKNGVDYLFRRIRYKALKLAKSSKYKLLFENYVTGRGWVALYMDKK
jgi:DNA-directed RNA polymerase specialized sigma subunit